MVNSGKGNSPMRGCTRGQRGPWFIRRATKKGTVTSLRFPSDKERENNKIRERARRKIKSNIFAGLRAHGGYDLPSNAHNNLVLVALCEEAGWRVLEDGTIFRKDLDLNGVANGDESINGDNVYRQPFVIENVDGDYNVDLSRRFSF